MRKYIRVIDNKISLESPQQCGGILIMKLMLKEGLKDFLVILK